MKKPHWTKRLKEENQALRRDLYKILDGDFETILLYKTIQGNAREAERMIWFGNKLPDPPVE